MSEENKNENEEINENAVSETENNAEAVNTAEETTEEAAEDNAAVDNAEDNAPAAEIIGDASKIKTQYVVYDGDDVYNQENVNDDETEAGESVQTVKKTNLPAIIGIVAAAVALLAVAAVLYFGGYFGLWFNKYNRQYIDTTGRTIEEVADAAGMTLEDFLAEYSLPANMPKNTYESAAFYTMPASKVAEIYGVDFDTLKTQLELPDEVTENDRWGEIEGEMTLRQYVGEENLEDFKKAYALGDEVTLDTKWKEIRTIVDTKQKESREEQEKAEAEAEAEAELNSDSADYEDGAEADADVEAEADAAAETEAE